MAVRGVRGATTADGNNRESILSATRELLGSMLQANGIAIEDIASVWLTTTDDLNAEYPAVAARELGWTDVALLCGHEMQVPHGLARCIRVLLLWNTDKRQSEVKHIYLRDAVSLRPDRER